MHAERKETHLRLDIHSSILTAGFHLSHGSHLLDMPLLGLAADDLSKVLTSLEKRADALAVGRTCTAFREVLRQRGFIKLWSAAHPNEDRLRKLAQSYAALDEEELETATPRALNSNDFVPLLPPRSLEEPPTAVATSNGSSPAASAAAAADCSTLAGPSQPSGAAPSASKRPRAEEAANVVDDDDDDDDDDAQLPHETDWMRKYRGASDIENAFTEVKLRSLKDHFAALDEYVLESEVR